jgi:hypothetical protein
MLAEGMMEGATYRAVPDTGWRKVFRDSAVLALQGRAVQALGFAVVLAFVAYFFIRDIGMIIFLLVVAAIGGGLYLAFRPSITLICTPDDFTLVHRNVREVFYLQSLPWRDIINARYEETVHRHYHGGRARETRTRTFALDLRDGYGVTFSENTGGFRDLIATVGEMTTHIPYVWVPASGAFGRVVQQAGDYVLMARDEAGARRAPMP